jgi:hypothetical protein
MLRLAGHGARMASNAGCLIDHESVAHVALLSVLASVRATYRSHGRKNDWVVRSDVGLDCS